MAAVRAPFPPRASRGQGDLMLEVRDLTKRYGPITALDGATFTAQRGRLVGFLGPNGAGKTTAMRCVFGLVLPEGGDVRWDGAPVTEPTRLRFGYMPEQRGLYPRMRVADQLTYFAEQHGMRRAAARASALELARAPRSRRSRRPRRSRTSPTATSSGSSSPRRSSTTRSCSCSTSRSRASTRSGSRRCRSAS